MRFKWKEYDIAQKAMLRMMKMLREWGVTTKSENKARRLPGRWDVGVHTLIHCWINLHFCDLGVQKAKCIVSDCPEYSFLLHLKILVLAWCFQNLYHPTLVRRNITWKLQNRLASIFLLLTQLKFCKNNIFKSKMGEKVWKIHLFYIWSNLNNSKGGRERFNHFSAM